MERPHVKKEMEILYEDQHLLAVLKPAGVLVVPSQAVASETLLERAKAHVGERVWALHRLDRDTSGIVVFGKTPLACKAFHRQFEARTMMKTYEAIVQGKISQPRGAITLSIGKKRWGKAGIQRGGQQARTEYQVREYCGPVTWVTLYPRTGRIHQIRVHLAAIGHPLAYDPIYHKNSPWKWLKQVPLFACSMTFDHPATGRRQTITAPLPQAFEEALRRFRKMSRGGRFVQI